MKFKPHQKIKTFNLKEMGWVNTWANWWKLYLIFTAVFSFLLALPVLRQNDTAYRYETAIRMHAYDIYYNNTSQLEGFNPQNCSVQVSGWLFIQFIDGECRARNKQGQTVVFTYHYNTGEFFLWRGYERSKNRGNLFRVEKEAK